MWLGSGKAEQASSIPTGEHRKTVVDTTVHSDNSFRWKLRLISQKFGSVKNKTIPHNISEIN